MNGVRVALRADASPVIGSGHVMRGLTLAAALRAQRRQMQIIFQDPYASLNPRMTVTAIIGEALTIHGLAKTRREYEDRIVELLTPLAMGLAGAAAATNDILRETGPELPAAATGTPPVATPDAVAREARAVLDSFGPPQRADGRWGGHIFNLGHGISQYTPPEAVTVLVEAVHRPSRAMRAA